MMLRFCCSNTATIRRSTQTNSHTLEVCEESSVVELLLEGQGKLVDLHVVSRPCAVHANTDLILKELVLESLLLRPSAQAVKHITIDGIELSNALNLSNVVCFSKLGKSSRVKLANGGEQLGSNILGQLRSK